MTERTNRASVRPSYDYVIAGAGAAGSVLATHDELARRAYQLFEERGRAPGREWEDWFRAEREL